MVVAPRGGPSKIRLNDDDAITSTISSHTCSSVRSARLGTVLQGRKRWLVEHARGIADEVDEQSPFVRTLDQSPVLLEHLHDLNQ
jgi:hypothetical protein